MKKVVVLLVFLVVLALDTMAYCSITVINSESDTWSCNHDSPYTQCQALDNSFSGPYTALDCTFRCHYQSNSGYQDYNCDSDLNSCKQITSSSGYCPLDKPLCEEHEDCNSDDIYGDNVDENCDGFANEDDDECVSTSTSLFIDTPNPQINNNNFRATAIVLPEVEQVSISVRNSSSIIRDNIAMTRGGQNGGEVEYVYETNLDSGDYYYTMTARITSESIRETSDSISFTIEQPQLDCNIDCTHEICPTDCQQSPSYTTNSIELVDGHVQYEINAWDMARVYHFERYSESTLRTALDYCMNGVSCPTTYLNPQWGTNYDQRTIRTGSYSVELSSSNSQVYVAMLVESPTQNMNEFTYSEVSDSFSFTPSCQDGDVIYQNKCCTPQYDNSCDNYANNCDFTRNTNGETCEHVCSETPYCDDTTYVSYPPSTSSTCQDGVCQSTPCTAITSINLTECPQVTQSCDDRNGNTCSLNQKCDTGELDGNCCFGTCVSPCYPGSLCSDSQVCVDTTGLESLNYETQYDISGTEYECCPEGYSCELRPEDCGDVEGYHSDCTNCTDNDGVDMWEPVNLLGTGEQCCPISALCDEDIPTVDCGSYTECNATEECFSQADEIEYVTVPNGPPKCCDYPSHVCRVPTPDVSCTDECGSGMTKCTNGSSKECIKFDSCWIWGNSHYCEYGCDDTDCKEKSVCTEDDDGKDYLLTSAIYVNGKIQGRDNCMDSSILIEWYCDKDTVANTSYSCPYECRDGKCHIPDEEDPNARIDLILEMMDELNGVEGEPINFAEKFKNMYEHDDWVLPSLISFAIYKDDAELGNGGVWVPEFYEVYDERYSELEVKFVVNYEQESHEKEIKVKIKNNNRPPVILLSNPLIKINAGQPWEFEIRYDDPDNDPVTFKFDSAILTLDNVVTDEELITWKNPKLGNYSINITVSDFFSSDHRRLRLIVQPEPLSAGLTQESKNLIALDFVKPKFPNEKTVEPVHLEDAEVIIEDVFEKILTEEREKKQIDKLPPVLAEEWEKKKVDQKEAYIKRKKEMFKETKEHIKITKGSTYVKSEDTTVIKIRLTPDRVMKNVTIYEEIPKNVAESIADLDFSVQPIVIRDDPLIMWHFEKVETEVELTYSVKTQVETPQTKTVPIAEEITLEEIKQPRSLLKLILPLMLIPMISGILIYFSHFKPKKKYVPVSRDLSFK